MRKTLLAVVVSLLLAPLAVHAETPYSCGAGTVKKLTIRGDRKVLRFDVTVPGPLNPVANGLTIEVGYEPEAKAGTNYFTVTLPNTGFSVAGNGNIRYRDRNAAINGVKQVLIRNVVGGQRITILRNGTPLIDPPGIAFRDGHLRVTFASGSVCGRTCGSPCVVKRNSLLSCGKSTDTALCGIRSGCELLNTASGQCLFPYPSSLFEVADTYFPSQRKLALPLLGMPANNSGTHVDPTAWNTTLDGYSPGPIGMIAFPNGVDLVASNVTPNTNIGASLAPGSPTVLLDADTGTLVPHFAENDVSDTCHPCPGPLVTVAPPGQAFMIRPAVRLKNGGHYIVALRGLIDQTAAPITAEPAFQALRDGTPSGSAAIEARRALYDGEIFPKLVAAGIPRANLTMAWDFHTATDFTIETWLVQMRDKTFNILGPNNAPPFTVTNAQPTYCSGGTTPGAPCSGSCPGGGTCITDPKVCRVVTGTYQVPRFVDADTAPALLNIVNFSPVQTGVTNAPFTVIIPCSLVNPTPVAGRPIFYGHGLLGSGQSEVISGHLRTLADTYGFVVAATDWQGMSAADVAYIVGSIITDFSLFRELPERLHQGILNELVLGRLMSAPNGFNSDPAFQFSDGFNMVPIINPAEVFYYGNSQGGIFGGSVMALSQETTRGVLGVPAANFSTLLQRSRDFLPFFNILRASYGDDLSRMLTYPIIQQLWDRAEPNGWYHHTISDPLPSTPAHKVLVHMATNDDEVSNLGTTIMVRSMGISQMQPVINSYYGINEVAVPPAFDGSAMHESDEGDAAAPTTNNPPADNNAHGAMRGRLAIQAEINDFLQTGGMVTNHCSGPCNPE